MTNEIMCSYNPTNANKFENLNEIYQFVKRWELLKLKQEELDNLNSHAEEIKYIINVH